jgi:hypothetical protein
MATPEELEKLRKASEESARKARELLDAEVKSVMDEVSRINELKPPTADQATYDRLVKVVTDATRKNESLATLKSKVEKLGDSAVSLFKEMAGIAKSLR